MEDFTMAFPTQIKKPFSQLEIGAQFYEGGERFKKTDTNIAWSIKNDVLWKEWAFSEEICTVADFVEMIPLMPLEDIEFRAERIKPIINGKVVDCPDLVSTAYTWDPKFKDEVLPELKVLQTIRTYHGYGYYGFFKPSIAEVLAQIPGNLIQRVYGFEIIQVPQTAEDLNEHIEYVREGFHLALTRLYERA
jgi:hypothetical protein